MIPLNLRTLLRLIEAEFDKLRLAYDDITRDDITRDVDRGQARAGLAASLARREASSLDALRGYLERDAYHPALDAHIRLDWAFPFIEAPMLPRTPTIEELIDSAEESDALLERVHRRIRRCAIGSASEFEQVLRSIDTILQGREVHLHGSIQQLDETPPIGECADVGRAVGAGLAH